MQEFSLGQTPLATSEAMSDVEAQEVLRLHLKRAEGAPQLSIAEVAEAIHLPEDEVRKLLADVREQKRSEDLVRNSPDVQEKKRRDIRMAVTAASIFIFAMLLYLVVVNRAVIFHGNETRIETREFSNAPTSIVSSSVVANKTPGITARFEGQSFVIPCKIPATEMASNKDLLQVLESEVSNRLHESSIPIDPAENQLVLESLERGQWDVAGVEHPELILQANGTDIAVRESMPIFSTSDPSLKSVLFQERHNRLVEMLKMISTKARLEKGDTGQTH